MQVKLEEINISLKNVAKSKIDKLNLIEIDNNFKTLEIFSIEKCSTEIEKSDNYSILLSSEFKESYNEYLQYLDLLCELKLKTERESIATTQDILKLGNIAEINNTIDDSYGEGYDVSQISHKILLSKIKLNVKSGIDKKVNFFNSAKDVYTNIDDLLNKGLNIITSIGSTEIIDYISSKFNLSDLSSKLHPKLSKEVDDKKYLEKILKEYSTIISQYNLKEKIEFDSSVSSS